MSNKEKEVDLRKENIKAYVGPFFPNFFKILPTHVVHVYERFPEKSIRFMALRSWSDDERQRIQKSNLKTAAESFGVQVYGWAAEILDSVGKNDVLQIPTDTELVILSVAQMGFS